MSAGISRARVLAAAGALLAIAGSVLVGAPAQAATYSISGTVSLPDGAPAEWLQAATVYAIGDDIVTAKPNASTGAYTMTVSTKGDYMVVVVPQADPFASVQPNLITEYWPGTWYADEVTAVTVNSAVTGIDFDLDYGATVSGTVSLSADGSPTEALVSAEDVDGNFLALADVSADGSYSLVGLVPQPVFIKVDWFGFDDGNTTYTSEYYYEAFTTAEATLLDLEETDFAGVDVELDLIPYFDDAYDSVFSPEIEWLASTGITTGWTLKDGSYAFKPFANVNRDVMAAFLYRAAGSPSYTPPKKSPFVDVPTTHVFYKEIAWLASTGISEGWSTSAGQKFKPSTPVNRDVIAAFLYRFAGEPSYTAPKKSPFVDVPTTHVFYKEIAWLASTGISEGWSTSAGQKFKPATSVKRDVMAAFLYRFSNLYT